MEPQSDECTQADQHELSPSTNTIEDLMTTAPSEIDTDNGTTQSEIDTDNGSTTGEGTAESLTVLPTVTELSSSTTQETTMEITTKRDYDDITQATNAPDTDSQGLTTTETLRRDQLDRIMLNFIVGKLPHLLSPPPPPPPKNNLSCMKILLYCLVFIHSYSYSCYIISDPATVSHDRNLSPEVIKNEKKASQATGRACHYDKHTNRCVQHDNED
jgi:hypothetical protein